MIIRVLFFIKKGQLKPGCVDVGQDLVPLLKFCLKKVEGSLNRFDSGLKARNYNIPQLPLAPVDLTLGSTWATWATGQSGAPLQHPPGTRLVPERCSVSGSGYVSFRVYFEIFTAKLLP